MRLIIIYLLFFLSGITTLFILHLQGMTPAWTKDIVLLFYCVLVGGIGGIIYCLRAVYLNACVQKHWDTDWNTWYYIRPIVSLISGGVSCLFLKAGLLVLDTTKVEDSNHLGFLALAFIAGYNVDKFMSKLEQISEATWGIKKSRSSKAEEKKKEI